MKKRFLPFLLFLTLCGPAAPAWAQAIPQDRSAAVIFAYNRIGEDLYPGTNIRVEQFEAQLKELTSGPYNVASLSDVVAALKNNTELPPNTVVLTFDGSHRSVLTTAVPLLEEYNVPFTLFIPTDHIDREAEQYMSWDDLRRLKRSKNVTIGLHPASYIRLTGESEAEIARQVNNARTRLRDELGEDATLFAYPFGEYSAAYRAVIEKQGFAAAFGQQSGVAYTGQDLLTLPRFPMTESYGGLDRFRLTARALPLPATDIVPADPVTAATAPALGFTIDPALKPQMENLSCFVSEQEKPGIEIIGDTRVELRLAKPLEAERTRINCTLPAPGEEGYEEPRWRWLGLLLVAPRAAGETIGPEEDIETSAATVQPEVQ